MTWLLDTLVWTGALIALVLLVRRPVGRWFGPGTAYALWLLPLIRLVLPPVVLPASAGVPQTAAQSAGDLVILVEATTSAEVAAASVAETSTWFPELSAILLSVWLTGAATYIVMRLSAYRRLRAELVEGARVVGVAGKIRLIETGATRSPLAFGVFDKVIALPSGFMASTDRAARDLALEHELAHHRAHDLAANFAALPLFAMHWFNPLSWLGWTAMRRDQEAACDARVIAGRGRDERARYAALIAGAAAAPRAALAAPMACPVLGDRSIVQRLRNLAMTDVSQRRRRTGRLLVGVGALMLPLTASVTYAQMTEPEAPPAPPQAPEAPAPLEALEAPEAPEVPEAPEIHVERIALEGKDGEDAPERVIVINRAPDGKAIHDRVIKLHDRDFRIVAPENPEFKEHLKSLEKHLGQLDKDIEQRVLIDSKRLKLLTEEAERAALAGARVAHLAPRVEMNCDGPGPVSEARDKDGRPVMRMCTARILQGATAGLRAARAAIASNREMSEESRAEVLETLDEEIARLEAED